MTDKLPAEYLDKGKDLSASVLVVKNGVAALLEDASADDLYKELNGLQCDTKALFRGVVKNARARHHLVFGREG